MTQYIFMGVVVDADSIEAAKTQFRERLNVSTDDMEDVKEYTDADTAPALDSPLTDEVDSPDVDASIETNTGSVTDNDSPIDSDVNS